MDNNKISVLMSTYKNDNAEHLKIAIESMINQTYKPSEIVIVEDGKLPQKNDELLNDYSKKYNFIRIVKLKENKGLGLALKEGVEACQYDYIARMDSDDISKPERLEKQIKCLIEKDVDIVGSNISEFIDEESNIVSIRNVPEDDASIKEYIKKRCPMNHVTVLFKKEKVLKAGNYEHCLYNEDYLLWIKLYENNCKFYNIQEELVNVRIGKEMFKRRGGKKYFESEHAIQKYMLKKGIIGYYTYMTNVIKRFILQVIMPNSMRQFIFKNFARKKPVVVNNDK